MKDIVSAVIFDLDHTLFDPRQIPADVFAPMRDALRSANAKAGTEALPPERLEDALAACWLRSFDDVAREFVISVAAQRAWIEASRRVHLTGPLQPYPDVEALSLLPLRRFLVTTGFHGLQKSKIEALGIAALFEAIHFDALDEPDAKSDKESHFRRIQRAATLEASAIAVVGDNVASEIAAGRKLGMLTIQIRRDNDQPSDAAHHVIQSFWDLPEILGVRMSKPGS